MYPRNTPGHFLTQMFPSALADLIQSYANTATQEMLDEVNQDINKLPNYQSVAWEEKIIKIPREVENGVNLSFTHFTNVTFANPTNYDNLPNVDQLFQWYNSSLSRKHSIRYVSFYKSIFINAKFDNMLCASFYIAKASFIGASFKGCILTGTTFDKSNLQFSDLSHCDGSSYSISHLSIWDSDFRHSNFTESQFNNCFIFQTLLDDANLSHTSFSHSLLVHCSLERANLCDSHFEHSNFTYSNLNEVNFFKANLSNAIFRKASLQNAKLNGAIFSLQQFTKEQVLSFHYDQHAREYIAAIYEFKEQNPTQDPKKLDELILSFIHTHTHKNGINKALAKFMHTGMLPGDKFTPRTLFTHQLNHPLRKRFLEIHESHHPSLLSRLRSRF